MTCWFKTLVWRFISAPWNQHKWQVVFIPSRTPRCSNHEVSFARGPTVQEGPAQSPRRACRGAADTRVPPPPGSSLPGQRGPRVPHPGHSCLTQQLPIRGLCSGTQWPGLRPMSAAEPAGLRPGVSCSLGTQAAFRRTVGIRQGTTAPGRQLRQRKAELGPPTQWDPKAHPQLFTWARQHLLLCAGSFDSGFGILSELMGS